MQKVQNPWGNCGGAVCLPELWQSWEKESEWRKRKFAIKALIVLISCEFHELGRRQEIHRRQMWEPTELVPEYPVFCTAQSHKSNNAHPHGKWPREQH